MRRPTEREIYDAVKFLRHWDRKWVKRGESWYKLVNDNQVEIFNEDQTQFYLVDLVEIAKRGVDNER